MKRIKNWYKTGFAGIIAISLAMGASAQRHEGGGGGRSYGGGGGDNRASGRSERQSSPRMEQPRQSAPMAQGRHEVTRGQRDQQSSPRVNQQQNPGRDGGRNMPVVRQNPGSQPSRQNFQGRQQPASSPVARNNNRDFRPGNSGQNNNFRPVSNNNRSFGGRDFNNRGAFENHYHDRAWGYGYNHFDHRSIGVSRFYYSGAYHPYPYYYRPFEPRWGIHINILPFGYYPFYFGSYRFFYNDGIFYQPYGSYYETVEPPLGAFIPGLPSAATPVVINGQNYYEYNGTYYQRVYNSTQPYEVVGVNGLLQNDLAPATPDDDVISDGSIMAPDANVVTPDPNVITTDPNMAPQTLSVLPENFKTVTLNNITYYVSPSGEYYTKNIDENGKVTYTVAAVDNGGGQ
jgi:hypothetical protein